MYNSRFNLKAVVFADPILLSRKTTKSYDLHYVHSLEVRKDLTTYLRCRGISGEVVLSSTTRDSRTIFALDSEFLDAEIQLRVFNSDTGLEVYQPGNTISVRQIQNLYNYYEDVLQDDLKIITELHNIEGSENVSWIIHESGHIEFNYVSVPSNI